MTHTYDSSFSGRKVEGMLRGFDPFMNLVIDDAIEYRKECFKLHFYHVTETIRFWALGGMFETEKKRIQALIQWACA